MRFEIHIENDKGFAGNKQHSETLSGGNTGACWEKFGQAKPRPPRLFLESRETKEGKGELSFADDGDDNSKELCALVLFFMTRKWQPSLYG